LRGAAYVCAAFIGGTMNVLFFLKPKREVAYLKDDYTLRQAIEKMERSGFTAIPMINRKGEYVGTLTEGDLLWAIKERYNMNLRDAEEISVQAVPRRMCFDPISVNADMEDIVSKAMNQNFVPVVDDKRVFIGIITRKDIIEFCYEGYKKYKSSQTAVGKSSQMGAGKRNWEAVRI
jgi:CBS domain-containing protein